MKHTRTEMNNNNTKIEKDKHNPKRRKVIEEDKKWFDGKYLLKKRSEIIKNKCECFIDEIVLKWPKICRVVVNFEPVGFVVASSSSSFDEQDSYYEQIHIGNNTIYESEEKRNEIVVELYKIFKNFAFDWKKRYENDAGYIWDLCAKVNIEEKVPNSFKKK